MKRLQIGLLDYGNRSGLNSLRKINAVVEEAILADQLGFSRFWLAEHHEPGRSQAWTNPQPMLPILATYTSQIKIGIAGVLMGLYQPYHVATFFKFLANVYPGRIDMGLANGYPYEHVVKRALGPNYSREDLSRLFWQNTTDLMTCLSHEEELFDGGQGIVIPPFRGILPQPWLLSISGFSGPTADKAIQYGAGLSRSLYHGPAKSAPQPDEILVLRNRFFETHNRYPDLNICVTGICHETDQKARELAHTLNRTDPSFLVGGPAYFQDVFGKLSEEHGVNEIIFYNLAQHPDDRKASIQVLSDVFDLASSTLETLPV